MTGQHSGRSARSGRRGQRLHDGFDVLHGHAARSQDLGRIDRAVHDGGFEADVARPSVEDVVDVVAEIVQDVLGRRGADATEPIRRRCRHAVGDALQQLERHRMVRHAQGDGGTSTRHVIGNEFGALDDQSQRSRPEVFRESVRNWGPRSGPLASGLLARDVNDQRVVERSTLDRVHTTYGIGITGDGGQSVHGFGGHGDHSTGAQQPRRLDDVGSDGGVHHDGSAPTNSSAASKKPKSCGVAK